MGKILSKISGPLLVGSILALGAMAFPVHADAQTRVFFRGTSGLLPIQVAAAEEDGKTGGSEEAPAWEWDGHFDMLSFTFPNGWNFTCQTGDWHTAADRETRFQMARTFNGQPAVGIIDANTKAFTYRSDAIEFTVSKTGAPTVTPGHALNGMLPPCYEPDPATNGALYRESPNPIPRTVTQTMAGTPVITSRRIH